MPHAAAIDESLRGQEMLFMRARLHVRGSMKRFSEGMVEDGVAAMYDAISSGMQRFTYPDVTEKTLKVHENELLSDDAVLFRVLKRSGIFDDSVHMIDFEYLSRTLENALDFHLSSFDLSRFLEVSRKLLEQLEIISEDAQLNQIEPISR